MSAATENNIDLLDVIEATFPLTWKLRKVWLCQRTFSIKARFKHEQFGTFQGEVKQNFNVNENMTLSEIKEQINIEIINFYDGSRQFIEAIGRQID